MEFIPVQILEEPDIVKKLAQHYIHSLQDLQESLDAPPGEGGVTWSKENANLLRQKIKAVEEAMKNGPDAKRDSNYVARLHAVPNLLLTLNGLNLVVGKRGTGKTSFALVQTVDAFLEI